MAYSLNPEFLRNAWLELTPLRLVAMPVGVLGIGCAAWVTLGGPGTAARAAIYLVALLLILWGSRMAAEAVIAEVIARTWDGQRMSSLGPWALSWGKLFGSTIYVWYGAAWCAVLFAIAMVAQPFASLHDDTSLRFVFMVIGGLLAQALAMLLSLIGKRLTEDRPRVQVLMSQALSMAAAVSVFGNLRQSLSGVGLEWYGLRPSGPMALLALESFCTVWTVIGIYRLMRAEMQIPCTPWVWLTFVVSVALIVLGLNFTNVETLIAVVALFGSFDPWFYAFVPLPVLTVVGAFVQPKHIMKLQRLGYLLKTREWLQALTVTPPFVASLVLTVCGALALLVRGHVSLANEAGPNGLMALLLCLFMVRDIGIIYAITLDVRARRSHLGAFIGLAILYLLVGSLVAKAELGHHETLHYTGMVVPFIVAPALSSFVGLLAQIGLVGLVLWARLSWLRRQGGVAVAA